jgi:geranylgeranylglycerol-phosphate geranylgeranyltransferase
MSLMGYIRITRPVNATVAGLAAAVGYLIATGSLIPSVLLLFVIVTLITAAGNAINDYFDAGIDAINRPERPIPAGTVTRTSARSYAATLFLAGVLVSLFTPLLCTAIAVMNSVLLVAYAARLKVLPLVGNGTVSYLSASIFLFGGALAGWDGLVRVVPVAVITFFAMLARELLKDAEDVEGDRAGGADTLPIRAGIVLTARSAFACSLLAAVASIVPFFWWGWWYLAGIMPVDLVIVFAAYRTLSCKDPSCVAATRSTTYLKYGMFASLVVFTLCTLLF